VLSHPRWLLLPSLKLIRLSIAELQRGWCGYITWPCDLDLWTFNLGQWSNMAGHVVTEPRLLAYFASKSVRRLGCRRFEEPKKRTNSQVNNLMREIAHAQKRNPLSDRDEILQDGRYPWHNHVGKFWWQSVRGFRGGGGWNFGLSHWLWSLSLQNYRTTVRVCDHLFSKILRDHMTHHTSHLG